MVRWFTTDAQAAADTTAPLTAARVKYWEIIADNLSKAGWSWGCVSAIDSEGRTIWIVDAHRDDGKRFVVHADEKLSAFLELGVADSHLWRLRLTLSPAKF